MCRFAVPITHCCLVAALITMSAVRLPARQNAPVPAPGKAAAAGNTDLPDTIRLLRRAHVGDVYVIREVSHSKDTQHQDIGGEVSDKTSDETETKTTNYRVRAILQGGLLKIEEHTIEGKKTTITDGQRSVTPSELEAWIDTYAPSGKRLSRIAALPEKVTDGSKNSGHKTVVPQKDDKNFRLPSFPDKPLHAGDTWDGVIDMMPKEISDDPNISYKAKLIAIERHLDVPCARVEYTLSIPNMKLPTSMVKAVPESAHLTGGIQFEGTITVFYTLDRGAPIETATNLTITMKYDMTVPGRDGGPELHMSGVAKLSGTDNEAASKFPAYDPALVPGIAGK